MIKNSVFCQAAVKVFVFLKTAVFDSIVYRALQAIVSAVAAAYDDSFLHTLLTFDTGIDKAREESVCCHILQFFADKAVAVGMLVLRLVRKLYEKTAGIRHLYEKCFGASFSARYAGFVALIVSVIFIVPHEYWANVFGLALAAVLVVLYGIRLTGKTAEGMPGKRVGALPLSLNLFFLCLLFSTFVSYDRADSVRVLTFFVTSAILCYVVYATLSTKSALMHFLGYIYGTLLFTSVVAVIQRILGVEADASLTDLSLNANMPGRVFSTLANPNNFAEFLVLFLPFAVAFVLNLKQRRLKALLAVGLLLPFGALLFTYSRSGWIAFAIATLVFVVLYDKRYLPLLILFAVVCIPFIPQNILNRLLTIGNLKDSSSSYRVDIWKGCLEMLKDYFFTGVGLGTGGFAKIYPPYAYGTSGVAPHSHMHFMEMLIELGVNGFVCYVCMTYSLTKRFICASTRKADEACRTVSIAAASSMMGIVLIGCFEYCWFYPRVMFAFFTTAGIGLAASKLSKQSQQSQS